MTTALSPKSGRDKGKERTSMSLIREYEAQIQNLTKKWKNKSMEKGKGNKLIKSQKGTGSSNS